MIPYAEFIARRTAVTPPSGRVVADTAIHESLKQFQRRIVKWACEVGRPAVWADTGLGKTRMQIEWCRLMAERALIITQLAVAEQTVEEASKIGVTVRYVRHAAEIGADVGLFVTSFEMVPNLDPTSFGAVALDESSILKQSDGKTRTMLIDWARGVPFVSAWSATPGPNDPEELTNQAEFLRHMTRTNMLAAYFVHDQDGWRPKGHAVQPMIEWMSSWAIALRRPSDIGDDDDGYILPGLDIIPELVEVDIEPGDGELFAAVIGGVRGRSKVRRESMDARIRRAVEIVTDEPDEQWLLWCGMNDEANALAAALGAVNVQGSDAPEVKSAALLGFARGDVRVLVTKPKIASLGLNFQACARMIFVGLNDSYEQYYQAIRRCFRYGQTRVVRAHIVLSELEAQIAENVHRKEHQANRIIDGLVQEWGRKAA